MKRERWDYHSWQSDKGYTLYKGKKYFRIDQTGEWSVEIRKHKKYPDISKMEAIPFSEEELIKELNKLKAIQEL